ncbi:RNA-binding protein 5-like isoform X2 [Amphiura filiformis]|uniref:RNA-binding protein 5-like isoform X2 n=1 Tax=Amphiura filiformis TaxID=82378 RepID=UPI003B20F642
MTSSLIQDHGDCSLRKKIELLFFTKFNHKMETEINQYLAEQRGLAEEQRQDRRDRNRDRDRRNKDRGAGRRNRFSDRDDRDKDRDYNNRGRDRDWESSRDNRSDRDGYGRNDRHQGDRGRRSRNTNERPSRTIMLKNCHNSVDDSDIRTILQLFGAPIKDVRLVKHRDTGVSRGFAFVEFQFLPDAQRWMEENQGRVQIAGHWAQMVYSANREREEDWFCSQCGTHNFKRREYCFKCSIPKEESEKFSEISSIPTLTLLLMGLDALTVEDTVSRALNDISAVDMNIRIARDPLTNTSRGLCYVDFASLELSSHVLDILCNKMSPPFSIDGKPISVHYCKAPQVQQLNGVSSLGTGANAVPVASTHTTANVAITAIAAAQWSTTADKQANLAAAQEAAYQQLQQQQDQPQQTQFDDSYYTQQYGAVQQQVIAQQQMTLQQFAASNQPTTPTESETSSNGSRKTKNKNNSGKRTAADITGMPVIKQGDTDEYTTVTVDGQEYPVYPPPDVAQYTFDEASGYYFDPTTGLYYDSTSQYYFNSVTQLYMYWDSSKSTYLPAPAGSEPDQPPAPKSDDGSEKDDLEGSLDGRKDTIKNKMAKKVAKDMARWAKSMNTAKMSASKRAQAAAAAAAIKNANAGAADAGFSMLMKKADPKETKVTVMNVLKRQIDTDNNPIVASYGGGSDSEDEQDQNGSNNGQGIKDADQPMTDWNKLICLLCKRQFPSREVLVKHQQFSDLHKQNLEAIKSRTAPSDSEIKYRDRAKERRDKYGPADPPAPKRKYKPSNASVPYEEPTRSGIGNDNIGNKMLKAMGWNESSGLGKKRQGRRDPIEVSRRRDGAGLGLKGSGFVADGDSYKDCVKKMTQYRYQELN